MEGSYSGCQLPISIFQNYLLVTDTDLIHTCFGKNTLLQIKVSYDLKDQDFKLL